MSKIITKKHRLEREFYDTGDPVSFAIRIRNRKLVFVNDEVFAGAEKILLSTLKEQCIDSVIHLFMPDHVHLILQRYDGSANILDVLNLFKQRMGFWFYETRLGCSWHKSYYDHIVRHENDIHNQIMYILANPVRAGLVEHWKDYKYKGSTIYDLDSIE